MDIDFFVDYKNYKPFAFYPYTSSVHNRFIEIDCGGPDDRVDKTQFYQALKHECIDRFNKAGIKAYEDNKTVFGFYAVDSNGFGHKFYIGFYDWRISIGFNVWTEHEELVHVCDNNDTPIAN